MWVNSISCSVVKIWPAIKLNTVCLYPADSRSRQLQWKGSSHVPQLEDLRAWDSTTVSMNTVWPITPNRDNVWLLNLSLLMCSAWKEEDNVLPDVWHAMAVKHKNMDFSWILMINLHYWLKSCFNTATSNANKEYQKQIYLQINLYWEIMLNVKMCRKSKSKYLLCSCLWD